MDNLLQLQTRCVAHEIRNHVSICDMYTEIIKKHLERSQYKNSSVENALDCIKKSLKIITTSLLDLKVVNNFEPKNCELKYLVEEGVRLASAYTLGKEIDINCLIKNSGKIYVDENKLGEEDKENVEKVNKLRNIGFIMQFINSIGDQAVDPDKTFVIRDSSGFVMPDEVKVENK